MDVHSSYSFYKIKSLLQTQLKKYMRRFFFSFMEWKQEGCYW